jgi:hypothetical protein
MVAGDAAINLVLANLMANQGWQYSRRTILARPAFVDPSVFGID